MRYLGRMWRLGRRVERLSLGRRMDWLSQRVDRLNRMRDLDRRVGRLHRRTQAGRIGESGMSLLAG
jgi:hypothetical protein